MLIRIQIASAGAAPLLHAVEPWQGRRLRISFVTVCAQVCICACVHLCVRACVGMESMPSCKSHHRWFQEVVYTLCSSLCCLNAWRVRASMPVPSTTLNPKP